MVFDLHPLGTNMRCWAQDSGPKFLYLGGTTSFWSTWNFFGPCDFSSDLMIKLPMSESDSDSLISHSSSLRRYGNDFGEKDLLGFI